MTSLVYLNNRYHDPTLGTFISVDPLVAATGEAYIYASGNPTTLSDPVGLCPTNSSAAGACYAALAPPTKTTTSATPTPNAGPAYTFDIYPYGMAPIGACGISDCPLGPNPPFDLDELNTTYLEELWEESTSGWQSPALGVCGGLEGTFGAGASYELCWASTDSNSGLIAVGAVGEAGAEGIVKLGGFVSNAESLDDLEGWSVCFGGSATAVAGGGAGGCAGLRSDGRPSGKFTVGVTAKFGLGASAGPYLAYTTVVIDDHGLARLVTNFFEGSFTPLPPPNPAGTYPGARVQGGGAPYQQWTSAGTL